MVFLYERVQFALRRDETSRWGQSQPGRAPTGRSLGHWRDVDATIRRGRLVETPTSSNRKCFAACSKHRQDSALAFAISSCASCLNIYKDALVYRYVGSSHAHVLEYSLQFHWNYTSLSVRAQHVSPRPLNRPYFLKQVLSMHFIQLRLIVTQILVE